MTLDDHPHGAEATAGFWMRAIIVVAIVGIGSAVIRNVTGAVRDGIYGHAHTALRIR